MKRLVAFLLTLLTVTSLLTGTVIFAEDGSLSETVELAERELYGMYTAATSAYLRDCFSRATLPEAGEAEAIRLRGAIDSLVPLDGYIRRELIGFDDITLSGDGVLRYNNAAPGGIVGASPFGMATDDCDGFVLRINSESDARLDLEIGRRGSAKDCVFVIGNIVVSAGEHYYLFPFECFGELPLDGTLNYISLSFTGTSSVTFGDMHAAFAVAENLEGCTYSEDTFSGMGFDPENYYKILQKDTDLALTLLKSDEGNGRLVFKPANPDDVGQLWQICVDPRDKSRFFITSKLTGDAVQPSVSSDTTINLGVPSIANGRQKWSFLFNKSKGYSIYIRNVCRLAYRDERALLKSYAVSAMYFDIREVIGERWTKVWSDEFNGDELDRSVWQVENAKNRPSDTEPMYNRDSPNNLYLEDGNLVIKTIVEEYMGYHATSAYLDTEEKLTFGYGRFEMRAKMPEGNKIWPAFWMMGERANWARCGEIDALEMVCGDENDNRAIATVHYSNAKGEHVDEGGLSRGCLFDTEKLSENYHLFAIEWDAEQIRWYFDDILYLSVNIDTDEKRAAFQNNPIFIILGTGIEGPGNNLLPDGIPDEARFIIDYIRYYKEDNAAAPSDMLPYRYESNSPEYYKQYYSPTIEASYSTANDIFYYSNFAQKSYVHGMDDFACEKSFGVSGGGWTMSSAISGDGSTVVEGRQISLLRVRPSDSSVMYASGVNCETPTLALNYDGSICYVGGKANRPEGVEYCKYLHIFETDGMTETANEYTGSWVDSITVASNGNYAFGCYDGKVRVRSPQNGKLGDFDLESRVVSLAFSDDGGTLFAADSSGNIVKFDMETKQAVPLADVFDEVYKLKVSRDGKVLLAACGDACARAYSTENGKLIYRVGLGSIAVTTLELSLDGKMFLLGTTDGKIGVYRTEDGLPLAKLENSAHASCWYVSAAFSSDARRIMAVQHGTGTFDSAVIGWELPADLLDAKSDLSPLTDLEYYDELAYTPESYAPYARALKSAAAIRVNRYSTQAMIDSAAEAVKTAAADLVEKPDRMKGDLDDDGEITVTDALIALRIAAKLATETPEMIAVGDTDADGHITVTDALAILRVAARLADAL